MFSFGFREGNLNSGDSLKEVKVTFFYLHIREKGLKNSGITPNCKAKTENKQTGGNTNKHTTNTHKEEIAKLNTRA